MIILLVPFAVFFVCCLLQFVFLRRVRQTLVANHPDFWLKMSAQAWFMDNAVFRFAFGGRYRLLNDPVLAKRVLQLRILYGAAILAWLAFAGSIIAIGATGRF